MFPWMITRSWAARLIPIPARKQRVNVCWRLTNTPGRIQHVQHVRPIELLPRRIRRECRYVACTHRSVRLHTASSSQCRSSSSSHKTLIHQGKKKLVVWWNTVGWKLFGMKMIYGLRRSLVWSGRTKNTLTVGTDAELMHMWFGRFLLPLGSWKAFFRGSLRFYLCYFFPHNFIRPC